MDLPRVNGSRSPWPQETRAVSRRLQHASQTPFPGVWRRSQPVTPAGPPLRHSTARASFHDSSTTHLPFLSIASWTAF